MLQKIYEKSPVWLQNILVSGYGFKWNKRRFGGQFQTFYTAAQKREEYTPLEWETYLQYQLTQLLLHAYEHVPLYRERFTHAGFTELTLRKLTIYDLNKLPILSKEDLRMYGKTKLLAKRREYGGAFFQSSGSTGTPVNILYSELMHQRFFAIAEARVKNWAGVHSHQPKGMIGGRRILPSANANPPYYRYNHFEKQVYFSAYHISPKTTSNYLEGMQKHQIDFMMGYATANYLLAKNILDLNLEAPTLQAVITSSEKLTPLMRATFEQAYHCKTYDSWSGMEYCGLISECEHGNLHISPDVGLIEVLDDDLNPVPAGKPGKVYCTGLLNYDQPLIRYAIGDSIVLSNNKCGCGRQMPVVEEIVGRVEDVVYGKDGRAMVRFHGVFLGLTSIQQAQVIQHNLEEIEIKIVANNSLTTEDMQTMINRVQSQLGNINVQITRVDAIPLTANGKFKAVISHLNKIDA